MFEMWMVMSEVFANRSTACVVSVQSAAGGGEFRFRSQCCNVWIKKSRRTMKVSYLTHPHTHTHTPDTHLTPGMRTHTHTHKHAPDKRLIPVCVFRLFCRHFSSKKKWSWKVLPLIWWQKQINESRRSWSPTSGTDTHNTGSTVFYCRNTYLQHRFYCRNTYPQHRFYCILL